MATQAEEGNTHPARHPPRRASPPTSAPDPPTSAPEPPDPAPEPPDPAPEPPPALLPSALPSQSSGHVRRQSPETALEQTRLLRTEIPGPRSRVLAARQAESVARGVATVLPVYIRRAAGGVLEDVDGNRLIDFGSGIAVVNVGNAADLVVEQVTRQASAFTHTCVMVTPYEGYLQVCEQLNARTPGGHPKRSALFNSGAEAVENAVKIARAHTGRAAIVVLDHAYHGRTNLTMAMSAKAMPYKHSFGPFAPEVYRAPASYPYREPTPTSGEQAAARAISVIETQVGASDVAAVVVEPIQGEGGFVVPAPGFLPALARWCLASGALLVADEIQTGFCRTGDWFACSAEGIVPDLMTMAKGIAGGLPLAAVTGRAEVMDSVHVGGLGGTYGGNPVACAAALGAMEIMEDQDLCGRARAIEKRMLPRLVEAQRRHPAIGDVRGRGAMLAIEIVKAGSREPDPAAAIALSAQCHAAGLVTLTCGTFGNVLRFLPPLVISEHLLDEGLSIIEAALGAVLR